MNVWNFQFDLRGQIWPRRSKFISVKSSVFGQRLLQKKSYLYIWNSIWAMDVWNFQFDLGGQSSFRSKVAYLDHKLSCKVWWRYLEWSTSYILPKILFWPLRSNLNFQTSIACRRFNILRQFFFCKVPWLNTQPLTRMNFDLRGQIWPLRSDLNFQASIACRLSNILRQFFFWKVFWLNTQIWSL